MLLTKIAFVIGCALSSMAIFSLGYYCKKTRCHRTFDDQIYDIMMDHTGLIYDVENNIEEHE